MERSVLSPWQHDGSRDIIGQALIVALLTLSNQKFWSAPPPRPQEDQSGSSSSAVTEQSEDY